jgi:hypothetical protein
VVVRRTGSSQDSRDLRVVRELRSAIVPGSPQLEETRVVVFRPSALLRGTVAILISVVAATAGQ